MVDIKENLCVTTAVFFVVCAWKTQRGSRYTPVRLALTRIGRGAGSSEGPATQDFDARGGYAASIFSNGFLPENRSLRTGTNELA
jgi:hypothetical protein